MEKPKNFSVGVDIGGTKTLLVICDREGNVCRRERHPTERDAAKLPGIVSGFIGNSGISQSDIAGIGFGVCGIADTVNGIITDAPAIGWFGVDLPRLFCDMPYPIFVENDVNCCAAGEIACGQLKGVKNAVYIAIGTGIGGAVVINGGIYHGNTFCAGEVGLTLSRHDTGTNIENRVSGSALGLRAAEYGMTSRELFAVYASEGRDTGGLIADFKTELAVMIANAVSLLNPECVLIGGGVARSMGCVIDDIRSLVAKYTPIRTKIFLSEIADEAAAIGAAMLSLKSAG
jgi:glucokinase